MSECPVCLSVLPTVFPCYVAPRYYVNENGLIVGTIGGCPYEETRDPDYLPEDILPRMKQHEWDALIEGARKVNYEDYENLWASRHRKNYHIDFDAWEAIRSWVSSLGDSVPLAYSGGGGRSQASYRAAVRWLQLTRGLQVVPNDT